MPKFHPDSRYLNDFAAGSLPVALAVVVQAHLEHCSQCRGHVAKLQQLGAVLFEQSLEPMAVNENLLDKVFAEIEREPHAKVAPAFSGPDVNSDLPKVLHKLLAQPLAALPWQKLTKELRYFRLTTGDKKVEIGLYQIQPGGKIPHHRHLSDEITLVLKGSFSDKDGVYKQGDFVVRSANERHQPIATEDEACLCLSALERPIQFTGWMRVFNGLLKVKPA